MQNSIFYLLLSLLLTSCLHTPILGDDQAIVLAAPALKQKKKISMIQKKLDAAEKEQKKATEQIERLQEEINKAQLALIEKQVESCEQQIQKLQADPRKREQLLQIESSALFLQERESLHEMIQTGSSSFEAQIVLDRILRMITELSDTEMR